MEIFCGKIDDVALVQQPVEITQEGRLSLGGVLSAIGPWEGEKVLPLFGTGRFGVCFEIIKNRGGAWRDRHSLAVDGTRTRHGDIRDVLVGFENLQSTPGELLSERVGHRQREAEQVVEFAPDESDHERRRIVHYGRSGRLEFVTGIVHRG